MLLGYNTDPSLALPPEGAILRAPAWKWTPELWANANSKGFKTCLVLDQQSCTVWGWANHSYSGTCTYLAEKYPAFDFIEAGNEPDGTGSASSQMTKLDFYALIASARKAWPKAIIISGGLVQVNYAYFDGVQAAGADMAGLHPYAQNGKTLPALLTACQQHTTLPIAITEWGAQEALFNDEHCRAVWNTGMILAGWQANVQIMLCYRYNEDGSGFGVQGLESEAAIADAIPNVGYPPSPVVAPPSTVGITQVPSPNFFPNVVMAPIAVVLHTMDGFLAGCDSEFQNATSQVSTHFGVGLDGTVHQYVQLNNGAWGNGILETGNTWPGRSGINPNYLTISIETEDLAVATTPVSDAQYNSVLALIKTVILPTYPSITMLMGHNIISPQTRSQCCGDRWWTSGRFAALATACNLTSMP